VFHVTERGWVDDGAFPADCVDDLTVTGMAVHTAAEFADLCADGLPERENVLPGSTGRNVEQVQIALVAVGYPIAVDGTYGPRTEAAVRDFQAANNLEADGIAGPDTQTALGL
jgi:peptidoglycan hydrolase-like protein with peptidoglycan-binding domain